MSDLKQENKRLSPLRAIRAKCLYCCLDQPQEVRLCPARQCAHHAFRFGKRPAEVPLHDGKPITPLKAIRARCIDCCGGSLKDVRECDHENCATYPYRMGTNPARKGVSSRKSLAQLTISR